MATGLPAHLSERNHEWVLDFCNFRSAWAKSKGSGIYIAHPDTGWTKHPELVAPTYRRDLSINFFEPPRYSRVCTPNDDRPSARDRKGAWYTFSTAHGTGTGGVIASPQGHPDGRPARDTDEFRSGTPDAYVSGAAPEATVIPFRVTENPWMLDAEDDALTKCIYHCIGLRANNGIDVAVMSISLGGYRTGTEKKLKDALVAARQAGIVTIAAAGQHPFIGHGGFLGRHLAKDRWYPMFPGASPDAICAAGCDWQHEPLQMAFYGKEVDISAPAVNVWMSRTLWNSDAPEGEEYQVQRSDGTSYATALTAAACALWQSHHGRERLIEIYDRPRIAAAFRYCLQHSADQRPGWNTDKRGAGVLDAARLLDLDLPSRAVVDQQVP